MGQNNRYYRHWGWLMGLLIGLGILLRIINLEQPVYWVDEVATSMRVSGYTQAEVTQQLATGLPLAPSDVLQFQQIRGDRSFTDLFRVLSLSPEHAPLYFLITRIWAEWWGTSIRALRSLSIIFSLLTLPAIFTLCQTLFYLPQKEGRGQKAEGRRQKAKGGRRKVSEGGKQKAEGGRQKAKGRRQDLEGGRQNSPLQTVSWTATGLLAISPFFIAYAQEARPYSLWILLLLWLNQTLWRSLHTNNCRDWLGYSLALSLSLYTSVLTVLLVVGQTVAVTLLHRKQWRSYSLATGIALLTFSPWGWVIVSHWQALQANTSWTQEPMPLWAILAVWVYGISVLFFDVPIAAGVPTILAGQMLTSLAIMVVIGWATTLILARSHRSIRTVGWFLWLGALAPPMALLFLDLVRNGQSAATPRYLMSLHLAILVTVAYWVSDRLFPPFPVTVSPQWKRRWSLVVAMLFLVTIASSLIGINQTSNYQKSRNLSNPAIVQRVNQTRSPQLIAAANQIQDIISLSYRLNPDVSIYILPPENSSRSDRGLVTMIDPERPTFLFNPSSAIQQTVKQHHLGELQLVHQPTKLIASELGLTLWYVVSP